MQILDMMFFCFFFCTAAVVLVAMESLSARCLYEIGRRGTVGFFPLLAVAVAARRGGKHPGSMAVFGC